MAEERGLLSEEIKKVERLSDRNFGKTRVTHRRAFIR